MHRIKDLHALPKVRDGWSYLYVEHCKIDREANAIVIHDEAGRVPVPCATLSLLLIGPGTAITHAAISALADNGCLALWTGEEGVRFYAQGMGETRSARNLLKQAVLWAHPRLHLNVVIRLYQMRFDEHLEANLTLQQIRGKEGARVRAAYAEASRQWGVEWTGRSYTRDNWNRADPINRALSAANSCLYGICHSAIVAAGYSPGLGLIHTGKQLSFVYDIADLYKTEISIPAAFSATAESEANLESRVRHACRDLFREKRILARIIPDIQHALDIPVTEPDLEELYDIDEAAPGGLWDPSGAVAGGANFATESEKQPS